MAVKGTLNGEKVTIASIYAPNVSQTIFLESVFQRLSVFQEGILILAGDCNYIVDLKLDRTYDPSAAAIVKNNSFTALHCLMAAYDLVDIWRFLYPLAKDYTFYSTRHAVHTRIDMIMISKGNEKAILEADIGVKTISDHSWTLCVLQLGDCVVQDKRWSLNTSLLQLDSVKEEIAKDIQLFSENSTGEVSEVIVWDALKATLRGSLIAKAVHLKKACQRMFQSIMQNIKRLEALHQT